MTLVIIGKISNCAQLQFFDRFRVYTDHTPKIVNLFLRSIFGIPKVRFFFHFEIGDVKYNGHIHIKQQHDIGRPNFSAFFTVCCC